VQLNEALAKAIEAFVLNNDIKKTKRLSRSFPRAGAFLKFSSLPPDTAIVYVYYSIQFIYSKCFFFALLFLSENLSVRRHFQTHISFLKKYFTSLRYFVNWRMASSVGVLKRNTNLAFSFRFVRCIDCDIFFFFFLFCLAQA